jgi:hypothetical protein
MLKVFDFNTIGNTDVIEYDMHNNASGVEGE